MNTAARSLAQSHIERGSIFAGLISRRHLLIVLLSLAVFISGFSVVCTKDVQRRLFVESQTLAIKTNQMQTQWGRLLLEQSTLSMQARIERIATKKLHMHVPNAHKIVMVKE